MQYPLSQDEQAAMTRYLSGIRKQLQDVSELFTSRYGDNSNISEMAVKAVVSATLLEHEMVMLEGAPGKRALPDEPTEATDQAQGKARAKARMPFQSFASKVTY